ncbi:MAG: carbohydrate kinase family protein [Bryobacteraceae bacterium]
MNSALLSDHSRLRYDALIGVGGIGAGSFFQLNGNQTLGREESRAGRFLDQRDYCKLHIIAQNFSALLGPRFPTILLGRVGDDDPGRRLIAEMRDIGLDVRHVELCPGEQTMFSICFLYPDGSGGNLTTEDSACSRVDAAFVERARPDFLRYRGRGIALAAPETPLESRAALLRMATEHGFFRAAAFTSLEVPSALAEGLLRQVDLLALNRSEAEAALQAGPGALDASEVAARTIDLLKRDYPRLRISITAGASGSWYWDGSEKHFTPALAVPVRNTAGAGDTHLGALLAGIAAGLSNEEACRLAALAAAYSVTSPHSIHPNLDGDSLRKFAAEFDASFLWDRKRP